MSLLTITPTTLSLSEEGTVQGEAHLLYYCTWNVSGKRSYLFYENDSTASPSAGCPSPGEPVNGSVSGFTSANVGSEVTYHCDTGLKLMGERVAVCSPHLVWVPNGSEVTCQQTSPGMKKVHIPTVLNKPTYFFLWYS